MELEEAIEILNNYLCETHRKFCSIGAVGIPNKEYFAIEFILNHLTKQEKMIELLIKHICDIIDNDDNASLLPFYNSDDNIEEKVKQYFEKKVEETN